MRYKQHPFPSNSAKLKIRKFLISVHKKYPVLGDRYSGILTYQTKTIQFFIFLKDFLFQTSPYLFFIGFFLISTLSQTWPHSYRRLCYKSYYQIWFETSLLDFFWGKIFFLLKKRVQELFHSVHPYLVNSHGDWQSLLVYFQIYKSPQGQKQ